MNKFGRARTLSGRCRRVKALVKVASSPIRMEWSRRCCCRINRLLRDSATSIVRVATFHSTVCQTATNIERHQCHCRNRRHLRQEASHTRLRRFPQFLLHSIHKRALPRRIAERRARDLNSQSRSTLSSGRIPVHRVLRESSSAEPAGAQP